MSDHDDNNMDVDNFGSYEGNTGLAIFIALENDDAETIRHILTTESVSDEDVNDIFEWAITNKHPDIVNIILDQYTEYLDKNKIGYYMGMLIMGGYNSIFKYMYDKYPLALNGNQIDELILRAIEYRRLQILNSLLDYSIPELTILRLIKYIDFAFQNEYPEIARLLIEVYVPKLFTDGYKQLLLSSLKNNYDLVFVQLVEMYKNKITQQLYQQLIQLSYDQRNFRVLIYLLGSFRYTVSSKLIDELLTILTDSYVSINNNIKLIDSILNSSKNQISDKVINKMLMDARRYNNISLIKSILLNRGDQVSSGELNNVFIWAIDNSVDNVNRTLNEDIADIINIYYDKGYRVSDQILDVGEGRAAYEILNLVTNYRNKLELLKQLEKECSNEIDPISQEEFRGMTISQLDDILKLGNKHCYTSESLYNHVNDMISKNRSANDPLDPSYILTPSELNRLYEIEKSKNPNFIEPSYKKYVYPTGYRIGYLQDEEFYAILLGTPYGNMLLGYIPSDIDSNMTGSTDLTSAVVISNIQKIWELGRLLLNDRGDPTILRCCNINLGYDKKYWYDKNGKIDIKKFIDFASDINRYVNY